MATNVQQAHDLAMHDKSEVAARLFLDAGASWVDDPRTLSEQVDIVGVPMPMADIMFQALTDSLGRGWGDRDTRAFTLLQQERAGVEIAVERARLKGALD